MKKFKELTEMNIVDLTKFISQQPPEPPKPICVIDAELESGDDRIDTDTQIGTFGKNQSTSINNDNDNIQIIEDGHGSLQIIMDNINLTLHQDVIEALKKYFSKENNQDLQKNIIKDKENNI